MMFRHKISKDAEELRRSGTGAAQNLVDFAPVSPKEPLDFVRIEAFQATRVHAPQK